MSTGSVYDYIVTSLEKGKLHMTLLDPGKMDAEKIGELADLAEQAGTSAIMLGGSTHLEMESVDRCVRTVKENTSLPIILFPAEAATLSRYADALYFMSMLNSKNVRYIVGEQVMGVPFVKKYGIEPISMGYIIIEPGMEVGRVGEADPISREDPVKAMHYSLLAQYFGMKLVYLEAGSGAHEHIPIEMVELVKKNIDIPLIVGGGIRTPEAAGAIAAAGADIIVTGTVIEESKDLIQTLEPIIEAIKSV